MIVVVVYSLMTDRLEHHRQNASAIPASGRESVHPSIVLRLSQHPHFPCPLLSSLTRIVVFDGPLSAYLRSRLLSPPESIDSHPQRLRTLCGLEREPSFACRILNRQIRRDRLVRISPAARAAIGISLPIFQQSSPHQSCARRHQVRHT